MSGSELEEIAISIDRLMNLLLCIIISMRVWVYVHDTLTWDAHSR